MIRWSEEARDMQLVEHVEDDEDCFEPIDELTAQGINAEDIKKLQDAGICICSMMQKKKSLTGIMGLSQAKVCEAAVKAINFGYMTGSDVLLTRRSVVTTGSQALDQLFGGGLETSSIRDAFGEFIRPGKIQLAHTLSVSTQQLRLRGTNRKIAYIDTEGTLRPDRRVVPIAAERFDLAFGAVLDNKKINSYEHEYNLLLGLAAKMSEESFRLMIIDSIIAMFCLDFSESGELAYERQQRLMLSWIIMTSGELNVLLYKTKSGMPSHKILQRESWASCSRDVMVFLFEKFSNRDLYRSMVSRHWKAMLDDYIKNSPHLLNPYFMEHRLPENRTMVYDPVNNSWRTIPLLGFGEGFRFYSSPPSLLYRIENLMPFQIDIAANPVNSVWRFVGHMEHIFSHYHLVVSLIGHILVVAGGHIQTIIRDLNIEGHFQRCHSIPPQVYRNIHDGGPCRYCVTYIPVGDKLLYVMGVGKCQLTALDVATLHWSEPFIFDGMDGYEVFLAGILERSLILVARKPAPRHSERQLLIWGWPISIDTLLPQPGSAPQRISYAPRRVITAFSRIEAHKVMDHIRMAGNYLFMYNAPILHTFSFNAGQWFEDSVNPAGGISCEAADYPITASLSMMH